MRWRTFPRPNHSTASPPLVGPPMRCRAVDNPALHCWLQGEPLTASYRSAKLYEPIARCCRESYLHKRNEVVTSFRMDKENPYGASRCFAYLLDRSTSDCSFYS